MALCSLEDVRTFLEKDSDTAQDPLIEALIPRASERIQNYAQREFEKTPAEESDNPVARRFSYSTPGFLSLAPYDLRTATQVTLDPDGGGLVLTADTDYILEPTPAPDGVYGWLVLPRQAPRGFGAAGRRRIVEINGRWGFAAVPEDVKHAAIVTVASWLRRDVTSFGFDVDDVQSVRPFAAGTYGLPAGVRHTLDHYRRTAHA